MLAAEKSLKVPLEAGAPTATDVRLWTMELVHNGALLRETAGAAPCLVGELRWLGPAQIGWFPAFADRPEDARVFVYDRAEVSPARAAFYAHGAVVAELTQIDQTVVEDPDDYRIGWQLWLEVAPLRRRFVDACFERLTPKAGATASPFA